MNLEPAAPRSLNAHAPAASDEPGSTTSEGVEPLAALAIQKKFAIFAAPQTGSSRLVERLDQHSQIRCLGEVFNPKGTVLKELGIKVKKKVMSQAGQTPIDFLNRIIGQVVEEEAARPYFGFKMMLHHDPRMIDYLIDNPQWAIIVLERTDLLGQWAATTLAKKSGRWETGGARGKRLSKDDDDDGDSDGDDDDEDDFVDDEGGGSGGTPAPAGRKVSFDAWKYEQFCFRMQARYASIYHRLEKRPHFKLTTEALDAAWPELLAYLGAAPEPLTEPQPAEAPLSLRDCIENYDALERYAKKNSLVLS